MGVLRFDEEKGEHKSWKKKKALGRRYKFWMHHIFLLIPSNGCLEDLWKVCNLALSIGPKCEFYILTGHIKNISNQIQCTYNLFEKTRTCKL